MDVNAVKFHLETFDGPLDLLLHLIRKNKVEITDIPVVEITRQYLEYLDQMKEFDMDITCEFLVMAAQLLYIKSKMLLPADEEEGEQVDPRGELVDRIIEYAKYKDAAGYLLPRQEYGKYMFGGYGENINLPPITAEDINMPPEKLTEAFLNVLERFERKKPVSRRPFEEIVRRETVPVSVRIRYIFELSRKIDILYFDTFFSEAATKAEAVSTFLAVLEMIRRGNMLIEEENGRLRCKVSGDESEFDSIDSDY